MTTQKTLFFICLIISAGCLAGGYGIAGQWLGAVIAILAGFAWLLAPRYPSSWLPHICLSVSVGLSVIGLLTGTLSWLMICGSGFSLAAWDLVFLDAGLKSSSSDEQTRHYENKHLQVLILTLVLGLMIALIGRTINLEIPFMVMLLLATLVIFGFERIWEALK